MKKILFVAMTSLLTSVALISCQKDNAGTAGPAGPAGATGATGAQGVPGNANVTVYNYGSKSTQVSNLDYVMTNLSKGKVDSSLVLAYATSPIDGDASWFPVPGKGPLNLYETTYFLKQTSTSPSTYTMSVKFYEVGTSNPVNANLNLIFTKFRIFIVPASTLLTGGRQTAPVNFSDYHAVCSYYNIPE